VPLRGELALPSSGNTDHSSSNWTLEETTEALPNILNQIARLSNPPPVLPTIQVSPVQASGTSSTTRSRSITPPYSLAKGSSLSQPAKEATSPWSNTISETASTEAALLPFLVHLAVVRDDADALRFCINTSSALDVAATPMAEPPQPLFFSGNVEVPQTFNVGLRGVAGGIVNVLDPASGRTPLHVAALNGSKKCAMLLLQSGALVHLRDSLDHTALYYVSDRFRNLGQLTQVPLGYRRPDRDTKPLSTI
jgi:lysophospholipase